MDLFLTMHFKIGLDGYLDNLTCLIIITFLYDFKRILRFLYRCRLLHVFSILFYISFVLKFTVTIVLIFIITIASSSLCQIVIISLHLYKFFVRLLLGVSNPSKGECIRWRKAVDRQYPTNLNFSWCFVWKFYLKIFIFHKLII